MSEGAGMSDPEHAATTEQDLRKEVTRQAQQIEKLKAQNELLHAENVTLEQELESVDAALRTPLTGTRADAMHYRRERITDLEQQLAIVKLAIPIEDELSPRIDEQYKFLSMNDGWTLNGIARLLQDCQRRMASDWTEIGRLLRENKRVADLEQQLQEKTEMFRQASANHREVTREWDALQQQKDSAVRVGKAAGKLANEYMQREAALRARLTALQDKGQLLLGALDGCRYVNDGAYEITSKLAQEFRAALTDPQE